MPLAARLIGISQPAPSKRLKGYAGLTPAAIGGEELVAAVWPRWWGRGIASEACRAVLEDVFGRCGRERVLACTDAPNFRSLALIGALGFRPLRSTAGVFGVIRWFVREAGR